MDIVFNLDPIGFTWTPFLDNYPTADYICHERKYDIPTMINQYSYVYTSDELLQTEFEARFISFQERIYLSNLGVSVGKPETYKVKHKSEAISKWS